MRRLSLIFLGAFCALCHAFGQAPEDWNRLSDPKDIYMGKALVKELGVWKAPGADVRVQVLQLDPIKTEQDVWNFVGGVVSGISKAGRGPTSSEVLKKDRYLSFRLRGNTTQEGVGYCVDTYVVLAGSHRYVVKAFAPGEETGFSISGWQFGEPLGAEAEAFAAALDAIKARLDSGSLIPSSVGKPSRITHPMGTAERALGVNPESASYKLGGALARYGISLAIVGLVIRAWARRVSRRTPVSVGSGRSHYYRLLLLKMSWRVIILFIASILVVILAHDTTSTSVDELTKATVLAFVLLSIFTPAALLISCWAQTKRRFSEPIIDCPRRCRVWGDDHPAVPLTLQRMDAIKLTRLLETFNGKAERVFNSKFSRTDIDRLTIGPDGIVTFPGIKDFMDELDSFVLTYRLFFQNNDAISIAQLCTAYQSPLIPPEMKESLRVTREHYNRFLDAPLITTWRDGARAFRELHDIVIYGELAHVNEKKADKFKSWDNDALVSHAMWAQFAIAVSFSISVIDHIQALNYMVISKLKENA